MGIQRLGLHPWEAFFATPGIARSIGFTLWIGIIATLGSVAASAALLVAIAGTKWENKINQITGPIFAIPHAGMAIALLFLFAPAGWLMRIAAQIFDWSTPPNLAAGYDSAAWLMIVTLIIKETVFLTIIAKNTSQNLNIRKQKLTAQSMGYAPRTVCAKIVLPQIYPHMQLPIIAVLSYGMSVVDTALILAPHAPPTLPVLILRWHNEPELQFQFVAAAGAVFQILLIAGTIMVWKTTERLFLKKLRPVLNNGKKTPEPWTVRIPNALFIGAGIMICAAVFNLALWSVAQNWRFPHILPTQFSPSAWVRNTQFLPLFIETMLIGVSATLVSLFLVVSCLESETRSKTRIKSRFLIYLPLIVPQISFLFGLNVFFLRIHASNTVFAAIAGHSIFIVPYMFLTLSEPWRRLNPHYRHCAETLGASANRCLLRVSFPLLLRPILATAAIGFAISVAQYLPTLMLAGGRVQTFTTEAVSLATGGDRRLTSIYALWQFLLPFLGFWLAALTPRLVFRQRRAMAA